jgi:cytochrome oxidase Cu insertion factor (SCO1/SenC/PrrC family)
MSQQEETLLQARAERNRNPYTLWFVVISFLAPVLLAYAMFFFGNVSSFSNKGELLNPVIDVDSLQLTDDNDQLMQREQVTAHKWHMIYFAGKDCDAACNRTLYDMRQINKAVGKNAPRLRHLLVHMEPADVAFRSLLSNEYPATVRANSKRATIAAALQAVKPHLEANEIYVMDPLGNIMMRFTQDQPPQDIIHDLNKLFKVSQIG